ncbi:hypothetical protein CTI12_AA000430 [Artemisia annua]|uniref:Uncharacterized protein n=1 Tax=Artemisia annua TaxID=35608 RepID=A0A2U1QPI1_ARTAN|nr:hypothetical protein CTI12_AA000430 [Artemisia annua]
MKTKKKAVRRVSSLAVKHPMLLGDTVTYDIGENPIGNTPHSSQFLETQPLDVGLEPRSSEAIQSSLDHQSIEPPEGQGCSVNSFHRPSPMVNGATTASANENVSECHVSAPVKATSSMDKGKRKMNEIFNSETCGGFLNGRPEHDELHLLCSEDVAIIYHDQAPTNDVVGSSNQVTHVNTTNTSPFSFHAPSPLSMSANSLRTRRYYFTTTPTSLYREISNVRVMCLPGLEDHDKALRTHTCICAAVIGYASTAKPFFGMLRKLPTAAELFQSIIGVVTAARTAREKMSEVDIPQFKIQLFGVVGSRQHELPSGDSIGAIVFQEQPDVVTDFDVIIEQQNHQPKRVNKLHASYMSLQFPLIFIYGEEGYHLNRYLFDRTASTSDAPKRMTMKMEMEPGSSIVKSCESTGKEIITSSEDISLATIKATDTDKALCVRAYRKWTPTNKNGKPVLFCCPLIDRQV